MLWKFFLLLMINSWIFVWFIIVLKLFFLRRYVRKFVLEMCCLLCISYWLRFLGVVFFLIGCFDLICWFGILVDSDLMMFIVVNMFCSWDFLLMIGSWWIWLLISLLRMIFNGVVGLIVVIGDVMIFWILWFFFLIDNWLIS